MAHFDAQLNLGIEVGTWETASELDNRGFNLYCGTSPDGWERRLNEYLIPSQSQGSPGGFEYTWVDDTDLEPGQTYWYWLEDVALGGATTLHGPVSATVSVPTAVALAGFEAAAGGTASFAGLALAAGLAAAGGLVWRQRRQKAVR